MKSDLSGFGFSLQGRCSDGGQKVSYVMKQRPLQQVLNFTGRTIDDVVNNPIAKNEVLGYYKLHKFVERRSEILDLEQQWNPIG
jgi:hypothetical protein